MKKETVKWLAVVHLTGAFNKTSYPGMILCDSPAQAEEVYGEDYTLYELKFMEVDGELVMVPQVGVKVKEM
jgi:hypothetical protein